MRSIIDKLCCLRRRRELGDGLRSFGNSVLGEFTGQHETHSRLNFSAAQGSFLVIRCELSSFTRNPFKDIVDERIHDRHTLLGNSGIWVDLL